MKIKEIFRGFSRDMGRGRYDIMKARKVEGKIWGLFRCNLRD